MRPTALLALVLLSCTCTGQPATSSAPQPLMMRAADDPACQPGDGVDDRLCLNEKIATICRAGGGKLELGSGTWQTTRPASVPGNSDNASLVIPADCRGLKIEGEGPPTTLMMWGDGFGADWAGMRTIGATRDVTISGLTFASDEATGLAGQSHLLVLAARIESPGQVTDFLLEGVHFRHPVIPGVAGDCLRMAGEEATPVQRVQGNDLVFESCDRSGWAVQRAVQYVTLRDPVFRNIGKTPIDMEPSGNGSITGIEIDHPRTDSHGISIAGSGGNGTPVWTTDVTIRDPEVKGMIGVIYSRDVKIIGGSVVDTADGAEGTINVKGSSNVLVQGVTVRRKVGSVAGPAIKAGGVSGHFPSDVTISDCTIEGGTDGHVVDLESLQEATVSGNAISFTGPTAATWSGIKVTATGRNIDHLSIVGNRLRGPMKYAVQLAGSPLMVGAATVVANQSWGAGAGLRCENPTRFLKPIVHLAGLYEGAAAAVSGCVGANVVPSFP